MSLSISPDIDFEFSVGRKSPIMICDQVTSRGPAGNKIRDSYDRYRWSTAAGEFYRSIVAVSAFTVLNEREEGPVMRLNNNLLCVMGALTAPCIILAQTVRVTPLGARTGEFCAPDRALILED